MPEQLSDEQEKIAARVSVAKVKTSGMKKGLAKQKNMLSAKKKDYQEYAGPRRAHQVPPIAGYLCRDT